jgi:chromosome segregation ATPase
MNPEKRLERLERFATRLAVTGRRTRNDLRISINALIDAQMRNEHSFNERFAKISATQAETTAEIKELRAAQAATTEQIKETTEQINKLQSAQKDLAESHLKLHQEVTASQQQTDEKLRWLIDIIGRDRNGRQN